MTYANMKKTDVISFRLENELKEILEKEALIKNTTVNNLLNNIAKKHIKWNRFADEVGLVFLSKPIFRTLLHNIDKKELKILATTVCRGTLKDAVLFLKGNIDIDSILEVFDLWLEYSHIPFKRFGGEKYVIQHDLGENYSTYLFTTFTTLISESGYGTKNACIADQTLDFEMYKIH